MISIIVPVYKVEPYLHRCIDSVLAQTYRELEIILVDDGSPDNCGVICEEYAEKDNRIRVIHQQNRGLSGARNAGLKCASGEYVAFLDSDDYVDSSMYEQLLRVLQEQDADIAECGYRWVKPDVTYDRENTGKVDVYSNLEALEQLYFGDQMFGGISIVVWNKLYRRSLLEDLSFAEGLYFEDVDFTPRVLYKANKIAKLNLNLYNFFFSPNSISRGDYNLKKLDAIAVRKRVMAFYQQKGLQRYYDFMESSYFGTLYDGYYNCYKRRRENKEYRQAAIQLRKEINNQYTQILKNPHQQGAAVRHRIFHVAPFVWYGCMVVAKKMKTWRHEK